MHMRVGRGTAKRSRRRERGFVRDMPDADMTGAIAKLSRSTATTITIVLSTNGRGTGCVGGMETEGIMSGHTGVSLYELGGQDSSPCERPIH